MTTGALSTDKITRYMALLADPDHRSITQQAWSVATNDDELVWAGWQPHAVVSPLDEPPIPTPISPALSRVLPHRYQDDPWRDDDPWPDGGDDGEDDEEERGQRNPAADLVDVLRSMGLLRGQPRKEWLRRNGPSTGVASQIVDTAPRPPRVDGIGNARLRHLATRDELHREESLARVGWIFVSGVIRVGERVYPCCFPLFERPVSFVQQRADFVPEWRGALRRHPLLARRSSDREADAVDHFLSTGAGRDDPEGIGESVRHLLATFGVEVDSVAAATLHPTSVRPEHGTVVVPGAGYFLARPRHDLGVQHTDIGRWTQRHLSDTALARLYRAVDAPDFEQQLGIRRPRTPMPLNAAQRVAIERLQSEPVVAVSGPPGTGKTHVIAAAASHLVAHGKSVLIATKSDFAAESACELLDDYPTPPHVRFGSAQHRRTVADRLSSGQERTITDEGLAALDAADDKAWSALEKVGAEVLTALRHKQAFEAARRIRGELPVEVARLIDGDVSIDELRQLVGEAEAAKGRKQRRAIERLAQRINAGESTSLEVMKRVIDDTVAELAVRDALNHARSDMDELWARLDRCETDALATQAILDIARHAQPRPEAAAAAAALATTLRNASQSGINIPIEANSSFLHHLPFWVGTLNEIEQTLPPNPAMFDVVIFDEASQIDQLAALPALCRAKQVLVVGDPQQLRHSSTLDSTQVEAARLHADLPSGEAATMLDIAANSLFDVAAAVSPVTVLDEHFRSTPHLIHFSAQRWYDGRLRLMTQHPRNEGRDAIDAYRVAGECTGHVNDAEVQAVVRRLRQWQAVPGQRSVAVITPLEDQARALERAIVDEFDYEAIREMRLRVGTVRGVQGTERDLVLLSLVLDDAQLDSDLQRFIEDDHRFNVMVTRARSRIEAFHSFDRANLTEGLLADWLRYELHPPRLTGAIGSATAQASASEGWAAELVAALRLTNVRVVPNYVVAGWTIDLVIGEGDAAFGVETTVHPEGPETHAERHLALRRAGWHLVSMFEPNWLLRADEAAMHLAGIAAHRANASNP